MNATVALQDLDFDILVEDGVPVEKTIHLLSMMLFWHVAQNRLRELGEDFYAGANQFVYYSKDQAQEVAEEQRQMVLFDQGLRPEPPEKKAFRGPDAFVVKGVPGGERDAWIAWMENDRLPDLVVELLSPSTAKDDYGEKKRIYQDVFKSSEYYLYEPRAARADGFRLLDHTYQRIPRSPEGRLWSGQLQAEVGVWHGVYENTEGPWLRLFYPDGRLVLTHEEQERQAKEQERQAKEAALERAEQERQAKEAALERAEQERQAKEAAEFENARLRTLLAELEGRS